MEGSFDLLTSRLDLVDQNRCSILSFFHTIGKQDDFVALVLSFRLAEGANQHIALETIEIRDLGAMKGALRKARLCF